MFHTMVAFSQTECILDHAAWFGCEFPIFLEQYRGCAGKTYRKQKHSLFLLGKAILICLLQYLIYNELELSTITISLNTNDSKLTFLFKQ